MSYPTENINNSVNDALWNMDFANTEGAAPPLAGMQGELSFPGNANAYGLGQQQQQQQMFVCNPYINTEYNLYDPTNLDYPIPPMPVQGQAQNYVPGPMPGFAPMQGFNAVGAMPGYDAAGAMAGYNVAGGMPNYIPAPMPSYAPEPMPNGAPDANAAGSQLDPPPTLGDWCIDPSLLLAPTLDASGTSTPSLGDASAFTTASSSSLATPSGSSDAPAPSLAAVAAKLKRVKKSRKGKVVEGRVLKKHAKAPTRGKERVSFAVAQRMADAELDPTLTCPFQTCRFVSDTPALHRRHIMSHAIKSCTCDWCGKKLSRHDAVKRHKLENCAERHNYPAESSGDSDSSAEDSE